MSHEVLPDGADQDDEEITLEGEEIPADEDMQMDSDAEEDPSATLEEIQLQNDSAAHFDAHKDSIFCIAQHPLRPEIVATGGGDDVGYVFDCRSAPTGQTSAAAGERESIQPISKLNGHSDSINAITFSLPDGAYLLSAGLDGRLCAFRDASTPPNGRQWQSVAETQEVEEINFLVPCPHPLYPNTVALGASDGSVWVYSVDASDTASPLSIVQAFYLHTAACTAGAWTPDGKLLATVAEDGSFYLWDVFGEAAAAGLTQSQGSQVVVGLTAQDERFKVDGGLYSVAISPNGAFAAAGGAEGHIRVVGLPRLAADATSTPAGSAKGGAGAKSKNAGGKQAGGPRGAGAAAEAGAGQAGQILASLQTQADSVETIAFAAPPLTLMATGSVDGSIALFDVAHRFAARRHIKDAHEEEAVIKVEFVNNSETGGWLLTSCGNDGILKRWDARGGTAAAASGFVGEWKGHRGGGEGGGILGFVQGDGGRYVVTAGDDGVALVFDTDG